MKIIKRLIGKTKLLLFPPWNSPRKKTSLTLLTTSKLSSFILIILVFATILA